MAWFDDLNLPGSAITGRFGWVREDGPDEDENPDVTLASGTVTFTPTANAVKINGAWIGIKPVVAQIFDGEIVVSEEDLLPVRVLSTDVETDVPGWGWRATFDVKGAKIPPVPFLAPASGVNLTGDLIPITGQPVEVIEGVEGKSAYEVAVANGYTGTEAEWLASLKGDGSAWVEITGKPETFPPSGHTHAVADVTGLAARLAAIEYDSGWRDITATLADPPSSGQVILRRTGKSVYLQLRNVVFPTAGAFKTWTSAIPAGFRPALETDFATGRRNAADTGGSVRVNIGTGNAYVYQVVAGQAMYGIGSWPTNEATPATLPGTPA